MTLTIAARTRVVLSRETVRRELHTKAYVWKRARLRANNDDPERACKLALVRQIIERLGKEEAFFLVDELDIHLLAKDRFKRMLEGSYTTSTLTVRF
jgi:hypothetical protein